MHIHRFTFQMSAPANAVWAGSQVVIGRVQVEVHRCRCGKERLTPIEDTWDWSNNTREVSR